MTKTIANTIFKAEKGRLEIHFFEAGKLACIVDVGDKTAVEIQELIDIEEFLGRDFEYKTVERGAL